VPAGPVLSAALLVVAVALPFASPLLTSACGTLVCPAAAPEAQQVLQQGLSVYQEQGAFQLDPAYVDTTNESAVTQLLFPALVRLDAHLQVIPWASSRYAVSADGKTYTFTLHPGMQWSDGTPIQAGDFAYAFNRVLDPCTASGLAYLLFPIRDAQRFNAEACTTGTPAGALHTLIGDSLLVTGPLTLVIKLERPAGYVLDALATWVACAVPRALVQRYGADWTSHLTDGGGFGGDLFKLTSVVPQTKFVLTRNERFWGTKPRMREIDFTLPVTSSAGYQEYLAGASNVTEVSPDDLTSARLRGTELHSSGQLSTIFFDFNWATPPFDDVRMRQAFALALDKAKLVSDAFENVATATNHIVPEGMPGYNSDLTGPSNSGLHGSIQLAQALAQAYANDKCQGSLSNCPPVTLGVPGYPTMVTLATEAQQMWQQALPHYPITIQKVADVLTEVNMVSAKQLQLYFFPWAADYPDPHDFLSVLCLPSSELDFGRVSLPEASSLIQKADGETDQGARISDYQQAEQLLVNTAAIIPLFQYQYYYVVRPFVVGFSMTAYGGTTSDIWQRVYIARH
jgi:peptide/nickel transport system substrate-binding protein/oligopeptide transport system substrate-binding protein